MATKRKATSPLRRDLQEKSEWIDSLAAESARNRELASLLHTRAFTQTLRTFQPNVIVCNYFNSLRQRRGHVSCRVTTHLSVACPDLWTVRFSPPAPHAFVFLCVSFMYFRIITHRPSTRPCRWLCNATCTLRCPGSGYPSPHPPPPQRCAM